MVELAERLGADPDHLNSAGIYAFTHDVAQDRVHRFGAMKDGSGWRQGHHQRLGEGEAEAGQHQDVACTP